MLDTVALTLNQMEFRVMNHEVFSPSSRGLFEPPFYPLGGRSNFSCVQNPTKSELEQGIYKPRLTITKRKSYAGYAITLRIEFSIPKLLFGNNFDELQPSDFEKILDILQRKLGAMGVSISKDVLRMAQVSAIHYGKNIALTDYSTCTMITSELAKINLSKRLDLSKTDYRNEGHIIRYHSNNFELAFYDKLKDLEQSKISEKRAFESENQIQADLFNRADYPKQLEVLRMEVRLGNRIKIKSTLGKLGIKAELNFCELFSADISQKILRHFWQESTKDMHLLAFSNFKPEDLIEAMIAESKGKEKPAKLLQKLGALTLIKSIGLRGAKVLLEKQSTARTWQRLKKELEGLETASSMKYSAIRNVDAAIAEFSPIKLKAFATSAGNFSKL